MTRPEWCTERQWVRFWRKIGTPLEPTLCWPWQGCFNTPSKKRPTFKGGIGSRRPQFAWTSNCIVYAHRLALALSDGTPLWEREGVEASHNCHNSACVNPSHLEWLTPEAHEVKDRPASAPRNLSLTL